MIRLGVCQTRIYGIRGPPKPLTRDRHWHGVTPEHSGSRQARRRGTVGPGPASNLKSLSFTGNLNLKLSESRRPAMPLASHGPVGRSKSTELEFSRRPTRLPVGDSDDSDPTADSNFNRKLPVRTGK